MIATFRQILESTLERLGALANAFVPPLLAGIVIFAVSLGIAILVRLLLLRVTRASGFERFLAQSGLSSMLARSGRVRAARLLSGAAYWGILIAGALAALSAFNTNLTTRMVEEVVFLMPKLAAAGAILLVGAWLAQYLGRSALVWTCNEGFPHPRRFAAAVRLLIVSAAVVIAADHLNFARTVFLGGFIIVMSGLVLAAAIAAGTGIRLAIRRHFETEAPKEEADRSLWNHL